MASELHPWKFEMDFFPQVGYPVAIIFSQFAATPESDVVRICAHNFQRHGNAFGTTENACFPHLPTPAVRVRIRLLTFSWHLTQLCWSVRLH